MLTAAPLRIGRVVQIVEQRFHLPAVAREALPHTAAVRQPKCFEPVRDRPHLLRQVVQRERRLGRGHDQAATTSDCS
jgi:hypothetical protein